MVLTLTVGGCGASFGVAASATRQRPKIITWAMADMVRLPRIAVALSPLLEIGHQLDLAVAGGIQA
ncbi:MAG TPA: hypothetical protein VL976_01180, partial [Xanthobacteraceae bacterium]|nr:hypothetical protein [Xanthobacteraceae bacterium]